MKPFMFVMMLSSLAVSLLNAQERPKVAPKHYKVSAAEAPDPGVTPDGRYRLYSEEDGEGSDHLFVRDLTSGESRPLTEGPGTADDAIISPDSRLIAYEWASEDRLIELRIVRIDGSGTRVLYSNRDVRLFNGARLNLQLNPPIRVHEWSPDGKFVAAALYQEDQSQLVLFSVADASVRVLKTQGPQIPPVESDAIVFDSERDGQPGIFVMAADGSNVRRVLLTPPGKDSGSPDWSPDRRTIAFASDRDGLWEIYVARADGSGLRRVTQTTAANSGDEPENDSPDWSPDGKQIAFRSGPYGADHIDVMNADGSKRRALTPPNGGRISRLVTRRLDSRLCAHPRRTTRHLRNGCRRFQCSTDYSVAGTRSNGEWYRVVA